MYDLRDPAYVPPHMRAQGLPGEQETEPGVVSPPLPEPGRPTWTDEVQRRGQPEKYPFRTLPVGGTFRVPSGPGQCKWHSFKVMCCNKSRVLKRKFLWHRYPDGTFEVYRES